MGGATHCSIVGCSTKIHRNKGLTFHRIPKKGGNNDKWRKRLLERINRGDEGFNAETASICSRHFKEECFKYSTTMSSKGKRYLIPGSLPTEWMPYKILEVTKPPERKPPAERSLPEEVQRVYYYTLEDVRKEATTKLPAPWTLVKDSDGTLTAGVIQNSTVTVLVDVQGDFFTRVSVFGIPAPHLNKNIESLRLKTFLSELFSQQFCCGIMDSELQEFAKLPTASNSTDKYFLHVLPFDEEGRFCKTTVRSRSCLLLSGDPVCKACMLLKGQLFRKQKKIEEKEKEPLRPNDPLHSASRARLIHALKQARQSERKAHMQLMRIKNNMQSEPVGISKELHSTQNESHIGLHTERQNEPLCMNNELHTRQSLSVSQSSLETTVRNEMANHTSVRPMSLDFGDYEKELEMTCETCETSTTHNMETEEEEETHTSVHPISLICVANVKERTFETSETSKGLDTHMKTAQKCAMANQVNVLPMNVEFEDAAKERALESCERNEESHSLSMENEMESRVSVHPNECDVEY